MLTPPALPSLLALLVGTGRGAQLTTAAKIPTNMDRRSGMTEKPVSASMAKVIILRSGNFVSPE